MASHISTFQRTNYTPALYHQQLYGNGKFLENIIDEELIEEDLGDGYDPNDGIIDYRQSYPPYNQYIKQKLIPSLNSNKLTQSNGDVGDIDEYKHELDQVLHIKHNDIKQCIEQNHILRDKEAVIFWSKINTFFDGFSRENNGNKDIIKIIRFYYMEIKVFIDRIRIIKHDINNINWNNLKLFRSKSMDNDSINKSMTISQKELSKYGSMALERLHNDNNNDLIPILVIDRIEWVLIVHIIDENCDIGISFKSNNDGSNVLIATAIYLDKEEIELKHKLIGLKVNCSQYLRAFKNDKRLIIGVDVITYSIQDDLPSDWDSDL